MKREFIPQQLIGLTTLIYGPTKTGKTTLIIDLLYHFRKHIPLCFVVSGSEEVKPLYSNYIHSSFIYKNPKNIPQFIEKVWKLQEKQSAMHRTVNNPRFLKAMCLLLPREVKESLAESINSAENDNKRNKIMKAAIHKHRQYLSENVKNKEHVIALNYLYINPRVLIIFDDCIASGGKLINESIGRVSFEGRHRFITCLLATQYPASIHKTFRDNAHYSIFCSLKVGRAVADLMNSGKETKQEVYSSLNKIFTDSSDLSVKAVYSNLDGGSIKPFKVKLREESFSFGCDAIIRLYKWLTDREEEKKKLEFN